MIDEKVLELYVNFVEKRNDIHMNMKMDEKWSIIMKREPYVCLTGLNKVIIRSGYWLYFTIKSDSIFHKDLNSPEFTISGLYFDADFVSTAGTEYPF